MTASAAGAIFAATACGASMIVASCAEPAVPRGPVLDTDGIRVFREGEFHFPVYERDRLVDTITTAERLWHHTTIADLAPEGIVVIKEHSGGNICQAFGYRLIVMRPGREAWLSERFGNCAELAIESSDGAVLFHFGSFFASHAAERAGQRTPARTWKYRDGALHESETGTNRM